MRNNCRNRLISERFCSKYLNEKKLSLLIAIDKDNIRLKNKMSQLIFNNKDLLLTSTKYDIVKRFASMFKSQYIKAWNVQQMFANIVVVYMNYINKLKSNLQLKVVEKPSTIAYYKKTSQWHKAGSIKEIIYHRHWTPFTKMLKMLVFIDAKQLEADDRLIAQYRHYTSRFGEKRIWDLVNLIKQNLLKKIHCINFKTGTWRCCHITNRKSILSDIIVDSTNSLYKHWIKIDLRKEHGDVYLPLQMNKKYHDLSKSKKSSWLVKCVNNKIEIIGTKESNLLEFHDEVNVEGIDLNVKHNFCAISNGKTFDYDRKYVKQLCKELKKLDKIGLKNIDESSKKHLNKICRRNEWYFKKLVSEVLDYCEQQQIYDVILEDLKLFSGSYAKSIEFGVKYSRLIRLLRLNSVKEWMKQQAEKRGIKVHLTPSYYSSQQCSMCGEVDKENRQTQEDFVCCRCSHHENADINAAKNLKRRFTNVLWRKSFHDADVYNRLIPKPFIKKDFVKQILSIEHNQFVL